MIGKHAGKLRWRARRHRDRAIRAACRGAQMRLPGSEATAHFGSRIGAANHAPRGTLVLKSTFHGAADVEPGRSS